MTMSAVETAFADEAAGAAAAGMAALGKRKLEEMAPTEVDVAVKVMKTDLHDGMTPMPGLAAVAPTPEPTSDGGEDSKKAPMSKAREIRLEQNRKAARESRRRKKTMIEELQRSVIFFSRANSTLKQQNDELSRLLIQSQAQVAAIESGQQPATPAPQASEPQHQPVAPAVQIQTAAVAPAPAAQVKTDGGEQANAFQQAQAQAVATQAVLESQGFPAAAARAAAQTMNASPGQVAPAPAGTSIQPSPSTDPQSLQHIQPGATMQAMASFQQAAAVAMQAAMQGMQGIPGVNMATMAAAPVGTNPQQAYTDTMTAFAMQQAAAAAAAAGQQVGFFPGAHFMTPMMWPAQPMPQMHQLQAAPAQAPAQAPVQTHAPAQAPAQAPVQAHAPAQAPVQTHAQAPVQTHAQAPVQTHAPAQAPPQVQAPDPPQASPPQSPQPAVQAQPTMVEAAPATATA